MQPGKMQRRSSEGPVPLRRSSTPSSISTLSTSSSPLSPPKAFPTSTKESKQKITKKVSLNHYHLKGLACLQDQEVAKRWVEDVLGTKIKKDFATSIENGVLLCQLMNKIRESSVPNIHLAKSQAYLALENINFFLSACLEMGVAFNDVFNPVDLYEKRNIPKVVKCILLVGAIATKLGFQPPLNYTPKGEQLLDQSLESDPEDVIQVNVNTESKLTELSLQENNAQCISNEEDLEGLSFEDLERTLSSESGILFPDLDRTITESDKGTHDGDSWMDGVSSIGSDIDSTSSEPQEWRDKEGSPVETTEYTLEELKKEFPFVDQVQIFNLRHIENFGRSALSTTKQTQQVQVRKFHYEATPKDPTDKALADYINDKFALEVPPNVSLPNPISRLGNGKYLFEDRVVNLKLTNGIILVRVGGGWMKLREALVRLSVRAACAALRENGGPSMVKTNISEWTEPPSPRGPPQSPLSPGPSPSPSPSLPPLPISPPLSASPSLSPIPISLTTETAPSQQTTTPVVKVPSLPLPKPTSPPPTTTTATSPAPKKPNSPTPPQSPKKPFPKIPPLKLPSKSSKPLLSAKAPALSVFPATTTTPKKRSLSLTQETNPALPVLPKPKINSPSLSSSAPSSLPAPSSSPLSSSPSSLLPPFSSPSHRGPLPISLARSLSLPSVPISPRDTEISPRTPRRVITPTSLNSPKTPKFLKTPRSPKSPRSSKDSKDSKTSKISLLEHRTDAATTIPPTASPLSPPLDGPFRAPRVSLAAPKLATLKGNLDALKKAEKM